MRYGAICKTLHVLPRSGGVLDQPGLEILKLEKILESYARYEEYLDTKQAARDRNRRRHEPVVERET